MRPTRPQPKRSTSTPEERASWAGGATAEARAELAKLQTASLLSVSDADCLAYSVEDDEGYEVDYHVAAPTVRPAPGRSVAQVFSELERLGLTRVERHAVDGRLEVQVHSGSETYYFSRLTP